jgi:group I intron endonuclease
MRSRAQRKPRDFYFIYSIEGPTGLYIGKTHGIKRRWSTHVARAKRGGQTLLHRAMRVYGFDRFSLTVLCQSRSEQDSFWCERELIRVARENGVRLYNLTDGGEGASGWRATPEQRAKNSQRRVGKPGVKWTEERKAEYSARLKGSTRPTEFKERLKAIIQQRLLSTPPRTHCKAGHALEGSNLYINRKGRKNCRECRRQWRVINEPKSAYCKLGHPYGIRDSLGRRQCRECMRQMSTEMHRRRSTTAQTVTTAQTEFVWCAADSAE